MQKKVVFITGASSGFGLSLAKRYIADGFAVYGVGVQDFSLEGLNYYKCDVRNFDDINKIISEIVEKEGRLDIVVSNAGIGISGAVEHTELEDAKRIMDINFFGTFHVLKAVLPTLRKQKSGRILVTSSIASFVPIPFQAFYSASKAAIDSLICATRSEVIDYNIKITSIQPADANTGFTDARKKSDNNDGYSACEKSVVAMEKGERTGLTSDDVAKVIYKCSLKKRPPLKRIVGAKYKFLTFILGLLPQRMREWAVRKFY